MQDPFELTGRAAVTSDVLGEQMWEAILQLYVDWANAVRMNDHNAATRVEQELRFFVLTFASLPVDHCAVRTGRKAIVRSMYVRLGGDDTTHVLTMLDAVIRCEEIAARRDASRPPSA